MATPDQTVIGLTLAKINGIFALDVLNARWSVKRANTVHITGAGPRQAIGVEVPSGSFDEVIPRTGAFDWRALKDFTVDIYDKETQKIVVASFTQCNWTGLDGASDSSSASTKKSVPWNGNFVNKA
ncbi:MAG: hypothetical protein ABI445_21930 [Polyangia bacterium]|jgi:hypothetical protein